jgi:hypothetical protein
VKVIGWVPAFAETPAVFMVGSVVNTVLLVSPFTRPLTE